MQNYEEVTLNEFNEDYYYNETDVCTENDWDMSLIFLPVLYILMFVLGLCGNGVVIFTVWKAKHKWGSVNTYIGNLAFADLAFLVTLPLWATYTALGYHWPFGSALCKVSSYIALLNMYTSVFCLTCLSFDRYLVIVHSLSSAKLRSRSKTLLSFGIIWIFSGFLALPSLIFRQTRNDGNKTVCDIDLTSVSKKENENYWIGGLSLLSTVPGFLLPLLLMTMFYCFIGCKVTAHFQSFKKEEQKKRRLLKIIITVVVVFVICWLPFHMLKSIHMLGLIGALILTCSQFNLIMSLQPYATCLAYMNSCLNPFLYAIFDLRFRSQCLFFLDIKKLKSTSPSPA